VGERIDADEIIALADRGPYGVVKASGLNCVRLRASNAHGSPSGDSPA
jgi:hypothetical protein